MERPLKPGRRQVVVLSTIDWDTAWQRHQIFAAAFAARGDEVFFVENTGFRNPSWRDLPRVWRRLRNQAFPSAVSGSNSIPDGVRVLSPRVLPPTWRLFRALNSRVFIPRLLEQLRRAGLRDGADCVVYAPTPTIVELARRLRPAAVLYDCASNFRGHAHAPADFAETERALLALADEVVCDSDFLHEQKRAEHPRVTKIHQGVPADFFGLKPPRGTWDDACYYGTWSGDLDERVPDALAAAGLSVTVRGFTKGNAPPTSPAVRRFPPVERGALAKSLEEHEVFLLPYRLTPFLMGVIPAKIYECLATGRPVIAAPLPSLKAMSDFVYVAETVEDWVRIAKELPRTETAARREARVAHAREHSTEAEFARFAARVDAARERRAAAGLSLDAVLLSADAWEDWDARRREEAAAWAADGRRVFIVELSRGFVRALLDGLLDRDRGLPPGVARLAAPLLDGRSRLAREVNHALLAPRLADLLHDLGLGPSVIAVRLGACPGAEQLLAQLKPALVADAADGEPAGPDAILARARKGRGHDAPSPLPSLLRGLGWIGALFGLAKVSTLLTQIAAGRLLGPEEFGRANLVLAAIAYLQIVPMLGFPTAIGKLLAAEEDETRRARFVSTALASFLAWTLLVMPLLGVVHRSLERALDLPPSLYALSLGLSALNALFVVVASPLLGLKRFAHRGLVEAVYGFTAPPALAAALFLLGADHRAMLAATGAAWATGTVYALWCLRRWLTPAWEKEVLPAVWRYAAVATLNLLAVACVLAPARFALHASGEAATVGLFSAYFTASLQVALALLHMLQSVVVPLASDPRGQAEAWALARRWALPAALAAWVAFAAALLAALAVFGRRYPLDWSWVALFAAAAAFALLHGVLSALYSARDFSGLRVSVTGGLITGAANVLLVVRLAPSHGVAGAAAALATAFALGSAWFLAYRAWETRQ
ncbi:MAG: oligosaccharide flippase family protein [Elusimicrobiota bacterium]|nr:oligosaccharide flippase family protein [Elusimicrobiota bacterium]